MAKAKEPQKVGNDIYGLNANWKLDMKVGKSTESEIHHSRYYHKYFHGYTEVRTEKANGRYKIERFYTDPWIRHDVTPTGNVLYRFTYLGLVVAICLVFWTAMSSIDYSAKLAMLVAVPTFLSVLSLILLLAATLNYVFMRQKMTWYDYRSSSGNLKKSSCGCDGLYGRYGIDDRGQHFLWCRFCDR